MEWIWVFHYFKDCCFFRKIEEQDGTILDNMMKYDDDWGWFYDV